MSTRRRGIGIRNRPWECVLWVEHALLTKDLRTVYGSNARVQFLYLTSFLAFRVLLYVFRKKRLPGLMG